MKKALLSLVLVGAILLTPIASAQTMEELQAQTNTLIQQLIQLLTQRITELQNQLAQLIAQQAQAVQNTAPLTPQVAGAAPDQVISVPTYQISLGDGYCRQYKGIFLDYQNIISANVIDNRGMPIIDAPATIITDTPNKSGLGWAKGERELNGTPQGGTTFEFDHANYGAGCYLFAVMPQSIGPVNATVNILGTTQTFTLTASSTYPN